MNRGEFNEGSRLLRNLSPPRDKIPLREGVGRGTAIHGRWKNKDIQPFHRCGGREGPRPIERFSTTMNLDYPWILIGNRYLVDIYIYIRVNDITDEYNGISRLVATIIFLLRNLKRKVEKF